MNAEPLEITDRLARSYANWRQGQSSTPRCEPPGEADIDIARTLLVKFVSFFEAMGTPLHVPLPREKAIEKFARAACEQLGIDPDEIVDPVGPVFRWDAVAIQMDKLEEELYG